MSELRKAKQIKNKAASRQLCVMRMSRRYQNVGLVSSYEQQARFCTSHNQFEKLHKKKKHDTIQKTDKKVHFMTLQPATIQISIEMKPYINTHKSEIDFKQRALLLYPFIQNNTLSHGKAAEILGMSKWSLIQLYGSMGIPYIDMEEAELATDIENALVASL